MVIPICVGQTLTVVPDGKGKQGDLFVNIHGFVVFIKELPEDINERKPISVKIVSIKPNCGIAVYEG